MKKFLVALPLLVLLGAGCVSTVTPPAVPPVAVPPTPVPQDQPVPPKPVTFKTLPAGVVTFRGVFNVEPSFTNPDVGSTIQIDTQTYGPIKVGLPGFIQCKAGPVYRPTLGETVEVHGNYADGRVDVCSNASYYIKKL